jgi:hypothetical protein
MSRFARFDESYYARHYGPRRGVLSRREIDQLARGVCGLAAFLGQPVERVLDVGAGAGFWRDWFRRNRPAIRVRSVDASPYACERFGHERRDISRWRGRERHDLVICHGVLQYLDDAACTRAIANLAAMSRGLLYLEVPTRRDLATIVDREASDLECHARPGAWYRTRLERHFRQVGAGLWAARSSGLVFYELEAAGRA